MKKPSLGRGLADLLGTATARHIAGGTGERRRRRPSASSSRSCRSTSCSAAATSRASTCAPRRSRSSPTRSRSQGVVQPIVVRPLDAPRRRRVAALRDHRRRAALARGADGGPDGNCGGHPRHSRRGRDRRRPHREHPAREPESAGGGARPARASSPSSASPTSRPRMRSAARAPGSATCCACWNCPRRSASWWRSARSRWGTPGRCWRLTQRRQQTEVALLVAKKGLSVRETEALVRRLQSPAGLPAPPAQTGAPATPMSSAWSRTWPRSSAPGSPSSKGPRARASSSSATTVSTSSTGFSPTSSSSCLRRVDGGAGRLYNRAAFWPVGA